MDPILWEGNRGSNHVKISLEGRKLEKQDYRPGMNESRLELLVSVEEESCLKTTNEPKELQSQLLHLYLQQKREACAFTPLPESDRHISAESSIEGGNI